MADVTITAANVVPQSGSTVVKKRLGATATAGQAVYADSTDGNRLKPAQCDGTAAEATVEGILATGGGDEQSCLVVTNGPVAIGGTLVAGTPYVLSATSGGIAPFADLVGTNKVTFLGYAQSTSILNVDIKNTGITKA